MTFTEHGWENAVRFIIRQYNMQGKIDIMTNEKQYLGYILRSYVNNEKITAFDGDWSALISLASKHSVIGILGFMVMNNPDICEPMIYNYLRQQCFNTLTTFSQRGEAMRVLIQKMEEEKIDHLLFKGFVVKDYYPEPELRTYGDIDFLIRESDRSRVHQFMQEQGFNCSIEFEPVYNYKRESEYYEIHTKILSGDISDKYDYQSYFSHAWEKVELIIGSNHSYVLKKEDHLIYLLSHIAKHLNGFGAGIRMYMDIAVFLQYFSSELDWNYITNELDELKFSDFANMVFFAVREWFGVICEYEYRYIDPKVLDDFYQFTIDGEVFGLHRSGEKDWAWLRVKQMDNQNADISKIKAFLQRLFPPAVEIEPRYTYLQGKHWLLPVAWLHRFIFPTLKRKDLLDEANRIANVDLEEIAHLKRLYKELGL